MLNILVIGTGMYSTGRGTDAYGTVLPAISEWHRKNSDSSKVVFVGTNGSHSIASRRKAEQLARDTGVNLDISFFGSFGYNGVIHFNPLNLSSNILALIAFFKSTFLKSAKSLVRIYLFA